MVHQRETDTVAGRMSADSIWLVDDDPEVRAVFAFALKKKGHRVIECADGLQALGRLNTDRPSLVLLDVEMPRLDGWKTLAEFRRRGWSGPVLMLTRLDDVPSRVRGLETGADDYLGKPCNMEELLARVSALLRRRTRPVKAGTLHLGDVVIDFDRRSATKGGAPLRLSRTDFALLAVLREHAGQAVTRETLMERVWAGEPRTAHVLDTHLWRLRKKLGDPAEAPRWIRNVPGTGYLLDTREE